MVIAYNYIACPIVTRAVSATAERASCFCFAASEHACCCICLQDWPAGLSKYIIISLFNFRALALYTHRSYTYATYWLNAPGRFQVGLKAGAQTQAGPKFLPRAQRQRDKGGVIFKQCMFMGACLSTLLNRLRYHREICTGTRYGQNARTSSKMAAFWRLCHAAADLTLTV